MLFFFISCFSFVFFLSKSLFRQESNVITRFAPRRSGPETAGRAAGMSFLDLPELAIEIVLEKLSPLELCVMASVCRSLRERCGSDRLWARHWNERWGGLVGSCVGETSSIMAVYRRVETGRVWFPAQVFNREKGHLGFMLSCYDAELCYDAVSDTFTARYAPHGQRTVAVEAEVPWERLRALPLAAASACDLFIFNSIADLRPGDHVEVQWRRNKEFPYGWWYGVVGHLDSCDGGERHCRCGIEEEVALEFNQYAPGSRWRRAILRRDGQREEGNEASGFYGGIRKLRRRDEIAAWLRLWPSAALD